MRRPPSRLALPALLALLTGCPPSDDDTSAGVASASTTGSSASSTSASSGTASASSSTSTATSATTTLTTTTSGTTTDTTLTSGTSGTSGGDTTTTDTTTGDTSATDNTTSGDTTGTSGTSGGGEARPFDCFGCVCDAADHFCVELQPGLLPPLLPDELCPDSTLFEGGCVPFPDECAQDPSCACLGNLPGACSCQKGESPVLVKCPLP